MSELTDEQFALRFRMGATISTQMNYELIALRSKLEATNAAMDDEQAAHQDTFRQWNALRAERAKPTQSDDVLRDRIFDAFRNIPGPTPAQAIKEAFASIRAEVTLAERGACATVADEHSKPNRFKPSETWRDDITVAQVYETAAIDVSGWIAAAIRARKP